MSGQKGICDTCHKIREVYAATQYLDSVGHFRPVHVCREDLTPALDDYDRGPAPFQQRPESIR